MATEPLPSWRPHTTLLKPVSKKCGSRNAFLQHSQCGEINMATQGLPSWGAHGGEKSFPLGGQVCPAGALRAGDSRVESWGMGLDSRFLYLGRSHADSWYSPTHVRKIRCGQ